MAAKSKSWTNQNISKYDIYNFGRVTNGGVFIIIFLNRVIFTKYKFESNRYSHRFLLLL